MEHEIRKFAATLLGAACLVTSAASLQAAIFIEPGDAGQTLAGAQPTGTDATTALTSITGTISAGTDADMYVLTITDTTAFSASTSGAASIDTSLFLFSSTGAPVIANDDQNSGSVQSTIFSGNALLTTLSPGTYYLGISLSGNEPVNSVNQLLFTTDQPTTNQRGAAAFVSPLTLSTFNGQPFNSETGAYTISLTGANTSPVPEPSAWALLGVGSVGLAGLALYRRRRTVPSARTA